jgi:transposase
MRSKAYSAIPVKQVDAGRLSGQHPAVDLIVGLDIGKEQIRAVARWCNGTCERPWRVQQPADLAVLVALLRQLSLGRQLRVVMEPTGTYGDAARQACHDAGIAVWRVSTKAAHDYAEIYDGVPSQHDGKDAAVVAELAALGKASLWPYVAADPWQQELHYWVDWLDAQQRQRVMWLGRLEALLARHWPEATSVLEVGSATLTQVLLKYGGPAGLAADAQAREQVQRWGGSGLSAEKVERLVATAATSVGVRQGEWDQRRMRAYAEQAWQARQQVHHAGRQLERLAPRQAVLQAQGQVVGLATACVLWVSTGDPRQFGCAEAYRKAMGLNLKERSSGKYQGQLRITKRGSARTRKWLYFAALRLVQCAEVRQWYVAKKAGDNRKAKRLVVAVMRKLALALYHVGVKGAAFEAKRLFALSDAEVASSAAGAPRS